MVLNRFRRNKPFLQPPSETKKLSPYEEHLSKLNELVMNTNFEQVLNKAYEDALPYIHPKAKEAWKEYINNAIQICERSKNDEKTQEQSYNTMLEFQSISKALQMQGKGATQQEIIEYIKNLKYYFNLYDKNNKLNISLAKKFCEISPDGTQVLREIAVPVYQRERERHQQSIGSARSAMNNIGNGHHPRGCYSMLMDDAKDIADFHIKQLATLEKEIEDIEQLLSTIDERNQRTKMQTSTHSKEIEQGNFITKNN